MKTLEQFLAARAIDLRLHFCEQLWRNIRNGTAILPLSICKPWTEYHIMETFQAVTLSELRTELTEFSDSYKKDHPDTWKEDILFGPLPRYTRFPGTFLFIFTSIQCISTEIITQCRHNYRGHRVRK
jgi:hypothetical protein